MHESCFISQRQKEKKFQETKERKRETENSEDQNKYINKKGKECVFILNKKKKKIKRKLILLYCFNVQTNKETS